MTIRIIPEPDFIKALKRTSPDRRDAARETLVKFQAEPTLPRLDFRSLKGHPGYFIIDARRGDRIILHNDAEICSRRSITARTTTSTGAGIGGDEVSRPFIRAAARFHTPSDRS